MEKILLCLRVRQWYVCRVRGTQFAHFIICEPCMASENGKCGCGKPNDVDGTCSMACGV